MRHGTREKLVRTDKNYNEKQEERRQPMCNGRLEGLEWVEEQREQMGGQGDISERDRMEGR
jgi:hypothetical protein